MHVVINPLPSTLIELTSVYAWYVEEICYTCSMIDEETWVRVLRLLMTYSVQRDLCSLFFKFKFKNEALNLQYMF